MKLHHKTDYSYIFFHLDVELWIQESYAVNNKELWVITGDLLSQRNHDQAPRSAFTKQYLCLVFTHRT